MEVNFSTALGVIMNSHVTHDVKGALSNETLDVTGSLPYNDAQLQTTRFVVQKILVPIVTCVGVAGNIISICVLLQRSMVSSTNCYLAALSMFDLLYVVFSFTLSWNHYTCINTLDGYTRWYPYGRVFVDICSNVSVYLTLTFSFERLIAVCFPMKGRIICTPRRARMISLVVILIVTACTSLEFFEWKTIEVREGNQSTLTIIDTEFANSDFYQIGYHYFVIVMFTLLPLLLLSTFNGLLIRSVLNAMKIRRQMTHVSSSQPPSDTSRRHREQQRITGMLVGVVVIFLVCQTPNAALLMYRTYLNIYDKELEPWEMNVIRIAGNIVNLLILLNASVNFIIYSFMSTKFRRVFLRIFCKYSSFIKRDVTGTYTSYYGNTTMTSKSPGSSMRFSENGDRNRNRISARCVHPVNNSAHSNYELLSKRNSCGHNLVNATKGFTKRLSLPVEKEVKSALSRPHIKYHMSATCERVSDSEEIYESSGKNLSLEEMARARERGSHECQCFHITSLRCLEVEDSNSGQLKIADTSI